MLNAEITGDNHLFTPLKKFPETFSEEERYIYLYYLHVHVLHVVMFFWLIIKFSLFMYHPGCAEENFTHI